MSRRGEVLVAIINNEADLEIARKRHWYRIPVESVKKHLKQYWQPEWIAFYQTRKFGWAACAIHYYAQVRAVEIVRRQDLFPEESESPTSEKQYYKLTLSPLEELPEPIVNSKRRRITFIPTTLIQLLTAIEIQDLSRPR
ncbi:MAG: hypothetical protein HC827_18735 [Cyanobacteria bacterium RM1_2_2]|nr:hypothetical protein [Cyanobacteria bacterium RM1_2_2]